MRLDRPGPLEERGSASSPASAAAPSARDDRGDFDWNKLLAKEITPPWVPPLKSEYDTSQFDSYPDDELPWAGCDLSTVTLDAQTELLFRDF